MNEGKYATSPGFLPVWRRWDSEFVLFDCDSGVTFVFDDVSASVLKALQPEPLTLHDLVERVANSLLFIVDKDLTQHIQTVLSELEHKKLIVLSAE